MRRGGGKAKGSKFERDSGKALSLWLTYDKHPDIFSRNVLSGGAFTRAETAKKVTARAPGDLMAAHPLAFKFLQKFSIECKHLKDIGLEAWLWDGQAKTSFGEIIDLARRQALSINLQYMVIAKQNNRDVLIFVDGHIGNVMLASYRRRTSRRVAIAPMYHYFHKQSVFVMRLDDLVRYVDPDTFLLTLTNGS